MTEEAEFIRLLFSRVWLFVSRGLESLVRAMGVREGVRDCGYLDRRGHPSRASLKCTGRVWDWNSLSRIQL